MRKDFLVVMLLVGCLQAESSDPSCLVDSRRLPVGPVCILTSFLQAPSPNSPVSIPLDRLRLSVMVVVVLLVGLVFFPLGECCVDDC